MARPSVGAWIRWILLTEIMIWALALVGPGYSSGRIQEDRGILAHISIHDPTYVHAVLLAALYLHLFLAVVLIGVRAAKGKSEDGDSKGPARSDGE